GYCVVPEQVVLAFIMARVDVVLAPVCTVILMLGQISIVYQRFAVLVDDPRLTHGEPNVGVPIQSIDEGLQQRGVRVIVRFGEPEIFTIRLAKPQVPLLEGTAVILCIESGSHILKPGVRFNDFATIVRGSIVKDEELEVLKRLGQDAIDALGQVPCVIIVRRDDRDSRHVAGPWWCQAARAEPRRRNSGTVPRASRRPALCVAGCGNSVRRHKVKSRASINPTSSDAPGG